MIDINEVTIGNISGAEIVHFEFSEGQLCGLTKGKIDLNRIVSQAEMNIIKSVSISIYPNSRLYHAKIDEVHNKTSLYFSELHKINNYVASTVTAYTATSIGTVSNNLLKLALNTATVTMDATTTLDFTGTTSIAGYGQNIAQFALSAYKFAYLRVNTATNIYHVHLPTDPYFSLGNDINTSVTLSVTPTTLPATYLNKSNFEVSSITIFCPFNEKIILNLKNFGGSEILSVTEHNPIQLFTQYIVSDSTSAFLGALKPFLVGNYIAVSGKIVKDGVEINVGDCVTYGEYQGVVNKVVRTPIYDIISFGYPPFHKTIGNNIAEDKLLQFGRT